MISNDYSFEGYLQELGEYDELITGLLLKEKTFILPDRLKADVSDLIDLINKFEEINTILARINFEKLTLEDITSLIDELQVLQKIIAIVNDDASYNRSMDEIARFHDLLGATIIRIQYLEDAKLNYNNFAPRYSKIEVNTKHLIAINQEKIIDLIKFVKSEFLLTDMNQIAIQNKSDQLFIDLFLMIAYIYKKLSLDVIYAGSHVVVQKYIQIIEDNSSQFKGIHVLRDNALFQDRIPKILEGLEKLRGKVIKSSKKEVKLGSWSFGDFGVKDLQEIFSQF